MVLLEIFPQKHKKPTRKKTHTLYGGGFYSQPCKRGYSEKGRRKKILPNMKGIL